MKKFKKTFTIFLLLNLLNPLTIMAYSQKIYAGGENIGIELNTDGVLIVGTYTVNKQNFGKQAGLKTGDKIVSIDGKRITNITDMTKNIQEKEKVLLEYERNEQTFKTFLNIFYEDGFYKTGLYVKDSMMGIGTLTYIDPSTKIYGCLGHEIVEKSTNNVFNTKSGTIFNSTVTDIVKSTNGYPGEKIARFDSENVYGTVFENTKKGVFGNYTKAINSKKLYEVAKPSEIKTGKATILTVISNNTIEEFDINIIKISDNNSTKNILFEITDEKLLSKTNGIVQEMSGSPIIQGNYIIGAVTHVVIDNPIKGYGIFITSMLEEGEN